jgi:hypothetical protein
MTVGRIVQKFDKITPFWGTYQIGVISPIVRVFSPDSGVLDRMHYQLKVINIYGFFPSVWGAAYVDFGVVGGVLYIVIWGLLGGWTYTACRQTNWFLPPLLLSFVLATILLSPIEGPLGIANSALVFGSFVVVGLLADLTGFRRRGAPSELTASTS